MWGGLLVIWATVTIAFLAVAFFFWLIEWYKDGGRPD